MRRAPRVLHSAIDGLFEGAQVALASDAAHHLAHVLRVATGAGIVLFDGHGREVLAYVSAIEAKGARVVATLTSSPRPGVVCDRAGVIWLQGMPKGDKLESIVQKATELGVAAIWPVYTERSVRRPTRGARTRETRVRDVAAAAAAQSGRADVPIVRDALALDVALGQIPSHATLRIVAWEQGGEPLASQLARVPANGSGCAVLAGPEGGLSESEIERARSHGFVAVSLGPRIWRTETVAPALLAVLSYARGDLHGT
jgi:16S rRNA (uracil1498-N3)-methyltransferase